MLAWLGALLIGLSLGLLGSGGSILTVPILVYLLGEPPKLAIAESLLIVGGISLVGVLPYALRGLVDWKSLLGFGLPSFVTGQVQLLVFAGVMLFAAYLMARPPRLRPQGRRAFWKAALEGTMVGALTGFVGVGGGFLIVPALVLLGGLPMHRAVGTSLAIVTLNAVVGGYKHTASLAQQDSIHWGLVLSLTLVGILGSLLGGRLSLHLPQERLRQGFVLFLLAIGVYIGVKNL
ncbi:MAG: sulfite exporter TauE/SafE family protein [Thermus sp.]|uniref:sulfite exporter TauE/SafE family protein n=1 Tax=Thermus sp. TaxID=275 RepID=UPI00332B10D0